MIRYTAECMQCQSQNQAVREHGPLLYDTEKERDEEVNRHVDTTGHTVAVGYIDTDEHKPNRKERRHGQQ